MKIKKDNKQDKYHQDINIPHGFDMFWKGMRIKSMNYNLINSTLYKDQLSINYWCTFWFNEFYYFW